MDSFVLGMIFIYIFAASSAFAGYKIWQLTKEVKSV